MVRTTPLQEKNAPSDGFRSAPAAKRRSLRELARRLGRRPRRSSWEGALEAPPPIPSQFALRADTDARPVRQFSRQRAARAPVRSRLAHTLRLAGTASATGARGRRRAVA